MDVPADGPDTRPVRSPVNPHPGFLTTPHGVGSGVRASYDDDDEPRSKSHYVRGDYDAYIEHDLEHNRVFMHVEKFMELVLKVPANWKQDLTILSSIAAHAEFQKASTNFLKTAKQRGLEQRLYPPLVSLYAAALKLLDEFDPLDDHDRNSLKLAFSRNDPVKLVDGVIGHLSPDIKALFDTFTVHEKQLSFANVVHVVEVKDTDYALCRGDNDFRVLNEDVDPLQLSRGLEAKQASTPNSGQASPVASSGKAASKKRTRTHDSPEGSNTHRKISKQSHEPLSVDRAPGDDKDPDSQVHPQTQCARYAMEHLSNVILRSHSILALFDRDRFQLEYFDRSVIAVSTAVDLSTDDGQKLFILMVYGLRRLSVEDLGLRSVVKGSLDLCTNYEAATKRMEKAGTKGWRKMFYGVKLEIAKETYTLKNIIFRQPGLIGRNTCVIRAQRRSGGLDCVVKFSCPAKSRATEMELIQEARRCATSDEKHAWVLNHLPDMLASEDVDVGEDSVQARIRNFLNEAKYANGKKYHYEDRCLRISVSEELFPLTALGSQRDVAQVFLDILQTHKWLYDVPRILHRDLSMTNIMFRFDEYRQHVYGVPNDFDLASWVSKLEAESGPTSLRRTGTPPYMAIDLQKPYNPQVRHLYRHDLESLFYVLVMFVCRYEYKDNQYVVRFMPPFDDWFDPTKPWADLQSLKSNFFQETEIDVIKARIAPGFKGFQRWVISLCNDIGEAFRKRRAAKSAL